MRLRFNWLSDIKIEHLWAITVMAGIFMFLNTHPIRPHDFWWHMAIGRDIVMNGQIPQVDEYSYTRPGVPYPSYAQFWLMEIVLYSLYQVGGALLIVLAQTAMVFPAYLVLLWICQSQARNWRAAALSLIFAFALGFGNWNVRPQAISYLLGAGVMGVIVKTQRERRARWLALLPVLMALWVNSHGSFPIGLAMIGIWLAEAGWEVLWVRFRSGVWQFRALALPSIGLALALLGCLLNPRGFGFINYLSMMAGNQIVQHFILEWMPPGFDSLEGVLFFIMFFGSAILLAVSPRRPTLAQLLTFILFGVLGLRYIRGIIWYGIAMAPVVAQHLAAILDQLGVQPSSTNTPATQRINRLLVGLLGVLAFFSLPWFKPFWPVVEEKKGLIAAETPIQATQFMLDQQLPTQVFHDMTFGSYLMWAAQPHYAVFVDSRVELYPPQIWDDYFVLSNALYDWEARLESYGINTLMLHPENQARLIEAASASPRWVLRYQDQAAVIFSRR